MGMISVAYLIFAVGSIIIGLVIAYLFFYLAVGETEFFLKFDTRNNVEMIAGLIAATQSYDANYTISVVLPKMECEVRLEENKVSMRVLEQPEKVRVEEYVELSIVKGDVEIVPSVVYCDKYKEKQVKIMRIDNKVWIE